MSDPNLRAADIRHFEHDDIKRKIANLEQDTKENEETIGNFLTRQADEFANFRLEFIKEIRAIERSIASKCEQDSAIIVTQNRHTREIDRVITEGNATAKALAVVASSMKSLREETDQSLDAAHKALRVHGGRIDTLEKRAGKLAIKVLSAGAGIVGTVALTYWITRLLEAAR